MFEGKNFTLIKANRLFDGAAHKIKLNITNKDLLTAGPGTLIFKENDDADAVYLIISGEIKLEIPGIFKKPVIVTKSANDFFGEKEFLERVNRKGNALAASDCQLCVLKQDKIDKLIAQDKRVFVNLYGIHDDLMESGTRFKVIPGKGQTITEEFQLNDSDDEDNETENIFSKSEASSVINESAAIDLDEISSDTVDFSDADIKKWTEEIESEVETDRVIEKDTAEKPDEKIPFSDDTPAPVNSQPDNKENDIKVEFDFLKELQLLDNMTIGEDASSEVINFDLLDEDDLIIDSEEEIKTIDETAPPPVEEAAPPPMKDAVPEPEIQKEEITPVVNKIEEPPVTKKEEEYAEPLREKEKAEVPAAVPEKIIVPEPEIATKEIAREKEIVEEPPVIKKKEEAEPRREKEKAEVPPVVQKKPIVPEPEITAKDITRKKEIAAEPPVIQKKRDITESGAAEKREVPPVIQKKPDVSEHKIPAKETTRKREVPEEPPVIPIEAVKEKTKKPEIEDIDELFVRREDEEVKEILSAPELIPSEDELLNVVINEPAVPETDKKTGISPSAAIKEPGADAKGPNYDNELEEVDEMTAAKFKQLMEAAQKINSSIKLDETLESILTAAKALTGAEHGYLYLVDRESNELWAKGLNNEIQKETRIKIGEDIPGITAEKGIVINLKDAQHDQRFNKTRDKLEGKKTKNLLCIPILNKTGFVSAVLELTNSSNGEFTQSDEEALGALSVNISLALENAELMERQLQTDRVSSMGKMANFLIQDIKKPVLTIKYYAEHIKKKEVSSDVVQILNMLIDQSNAVVDLVQTTLSYSEGKGIMRAQPLRLSTVLNDIFNLLAEYVESRHVNLFKKYEADAVVNIDKREFYQACFQIVKNACDAMPKGGDIYVLVKIEGGTVRIEFKDSGVGIPESIKAKIFEPFMSHGKKQGVGLGLAIAEKIVKDHSGEITFESEIGEGTTFRIALPYISVV